MKFGTIHPAILQRILFYHSLETFSIRGWKLETLKHETQQGQVPFAPSCFLLDLKSKVDNIVTKVTVLRVNLNIDVIPNRTSPDYNDYFK